MDSLVRSVKDLKNKKDPSEIGIVTKLDPFTFEINGQEYSSENFTIYLPAMDRIKQHKNISTTTNRTDVKIGDLEMEPDNDYRMFLVGDLIDVTDRGNSFIVHGRLIKLGEEKTLYDPIGRG